jgi:peptidoglycan/LPS O-acetylase OafA/YrhL
MSNFRYRPEVDGLRAVAVLGVVLFHIGLGFPGGYVGVDVFFVISGFLITGIIIKGLKRGTFSMLDFWVRRIRRILPAVSVMVVVSLIAGYFLLSPNNFENLAKSSIAQSLMASNVFFWLDTGYFSESADYKPLLHTWSLAVEEQFYVVFPLVLLALWKWRKQYLVPALLLLGSISLILSCVGVLYNQQATFFLLPSRAWEMVAGGLLAVWSAKKEFSKKWSEIFAWSGLLMILGAMIFYSSETLFPGWAAILPVGGSVLFIGANKNQLTTAGKLLALKPVVFIGLISYSLYLWHWPLLAFARNIIIDINLPWKLALFGGSMILAVISWMFVETPFRKKTVLATKVSAFSFGAISTAALLVVSVLIWKSEGLPARIDQKYVIFIEDIDWTGSEYVYDGGDDVLLGKAEDSDRVKPIDFVLWGDSHAMAVAGAVDELAEEHGLRGLSFVRSATPPVPGLCRYIDSSKKRAQMLQRNDILMDKIEKLGVKNVILVASWENYFDASLMSSLNKEAGKKTALMRIDDSKWSMNEDEDYSSMLDRCLHKMMQRLNKSNVNIWIMKKVPRISDQHCAKHVYMMKRYPSINHLQKQVLPIKDSRRLRELVNKAIVRSEKAGAIVIDPTPFFVSDSGEIQIYEGRSFYRDKGHLTRPGAKHYLTGVLGKIFRKIKNEQDK